MLNLNKQKLQKIFAQSAKICKMQSVNQSNCNFGTFNQQPGGNNDHRNGYNY